MSQINIYLKENKNDILNVLEFETMFKIVSNIDMFNLTRLFTARKEKKNIFSKCKKILAPGDLKYIKFSDLHHRRKKK